MFTVEGYRDGIPYRVTVEDVPDRAGQVLVGSFALRADIESHRGVSVSATPTGPSYSVDPADPEAVLAYLISKTRVLAVGGDAPDILPSLPEDEES